MNVPIRAKVASVLIYSSRTNIVCASIVHSKDRTEHIASAIAQILRTGVHMKGVDLSGVALAIFHTLCLCWQVRLDHGDGQ